MGQVDAFKFKRKTVESCGNTEHANHHSALFNNHLLSLLPFDASLDLCVFSALVSVSAGRLHQYHFVNERKSWTDAQRYCRDKYIDLVTINDTQDLSDIELVIPRGNPAANADLVWIGLRSTDTLIWSLNDPNFNTANQSEYRNWDPAQTKGEGDCVFMNKVGKWYDDMCNQEYHFICYDGEFRSQHTEMS